MKKIENKITIGEEIIIGGGNIGFIFDDNTEKFPNEITLINKTDEGIFQFGNEENGMFNYDEWKNFINNDPIRSKKTKDTILERMKAEINNY